MHKLKMHLITIRKHWLNLFVFLLFYKSSILLPVNKREVKHEKKVYNIRHFFGAYSLNEGLAFSYSKSLQYLFINQSMSINYQFYQINFATIAAANEATNSISLKEVIILNNQISRILSSLILCNILW